MSDAAVVPLMSHRQYHDLGAWIDAAWQQYRAMVDDPGIRLWGRPVLAGRRETSDGRTERFWHLITDSEHGGDKRTLSLRRVAIVGRVWDLLERLSVGDPSACWWRETGQGTSLLVAPRDFSFVVVLRERPASFQLITAYPCEPHTFVGRYTDSWARGLSREGCYCSRCRPEPVPHTRPHNGRARRWLAYDLRMTGCG